MAENIVPIKIEGINESIFAGFWIRLGALLLDFVIILPISILNMIISAHGKEMFVYTFAPIFIFGLWFNIYLVKKYGGTPGKLILGIKIIKLNGSNVGWKEAILRNLVLMVLTLFGSVVMLLKFTYADSAYYESLNWFQQQTYLALFVPGLSLVYMWLVNIWTYGEFIVLLTNKRKRAVHDYIAGTVIVKTQYLSTIRNIITKKENNNLSIDSQ